MLNVLLPTTLSDSLDGNNNLTDFENYIVHLDENNNLLNVYNCINGIQFDDNEYITTNGCGQINLTNGTFGVLDNPVCSPCPGITCSCDCDSNNPIRLEIKNPIISISPSGANTSFRVSVTDGSTSPNTLQTFTYASPNTTEGIYFNDGLFYILAK